MAFIQWVLPFFGILYFIYYRIKKRYSYFKDRGMPYIEADETAYSNIPGQAVFTDGLHQMYLKMKGKKFCGFFNISRPCILIRDPQLVQRVLIKDFPHFQDHGSKTDTKLNSFERDLFNMKGDSWKEMRWKLSPAFTKEKLNWMFLTIEKEAFLFVKSLASGDINLKSVTMKYSNDILGSIMFGQRVDRIDSEESKFMKMPYLKEEETNFKTMLWTFIESLFPFNYLYVKIKKIQEKTNDYFLSILSNTFKYRRDNSIIREDVAQLLMELKDNNEINIKLERDEEKELSLYRTIGNELEFTDEVLTGQASGFYKGGVGPVSATLSFAVLELAKHPSIQEGVRGEILNKCLTIPGSLSSYDFISKLTYLDAVVSETLRLHTQIPLLIRECGGSLSLVDGLTIEQGVPIYIPVSSLHMDPSLHTEPDAFRPTRFLEDDGIPQGAYLPFGDGPRTCIGRRLSLFIIKTALVKILMNFKLTISEKTEIPPTSDTMGTPAWLLIDKLWIRLEQL